MPSVGPIWFLFAVVRDVQRNPPVAQADTTQFLFAVVRDVQRNYVRTYRFVFAPVSIRCRARRTAEPATPRSAPTRSPRRVSIRCRARRTAEHTESRFNTAFRERFLFAVVRDVQRNSCFFDHDTMRWFGFYSLSCETYSGTVLVTVATDSDAEFLFAVVRDVQRNELRDRQGHADPHRFYSLSCETYSGTLACGQSVTVALVSIRCRARRTAERCPVVRLDWGCESSFLFAVVRDVQRNWERGGRCLSHGVSIRCRARRTAELTADWEDLTNPSFYWLSCETYSGTRCSAVPIIRRAFLFAVVRDVQRNAVGDAYLRSHPELFLFAVVRDVQRNSGHLGASRAGRGFLFAVVRDVQRNHDWRRIDARRGVSIRCRARRTAEPGV